MPVKFQVVPPRPRVPFASRRRDRASSSHLRVFAVLARKTKRHLATITLPPSSEDDTRRFLALCTARLLKLGAGSGAVMADTMRIRARVLLEGAKLYARDTAAKARVVRALDPLPWSSEAAQGHGQPHDVDQQNRDGHHADQHDD